MSLNHVRGLIPLILIFLLLREGLAITADNIIAAGPGLIPDKIVLPARYFFLYSNNSEPINEKYLKVEISGTIQDKHPCPLLRQVLNRKDGTFIVRYKLHGTCSRLKLIVMYQSSLVRGFPLIIEGPVYHEECDCPDESINEWMDNFQCKSIPKQIHEDLKQYPTVNFNNIHEKAIKRFNNSMSSSVCHYVIKSNKVYRTCYGQHVGFKMFMDAILLSLTRKVKLPDLEFYSNLGDWPLMKKGNTNNFPMFSWCGSEDTVDIVMPTYDLTESTLGCMGRVSLDMLSVQGNIDKTWHEKENKAFWRGRDSSRERLKLVELSRKHPELINASLTNFFFFREEEKVYGPKEKHISFFKFFDYKYQVNLDGTVAAYRFPYLLAGDSVVFKQDSHYYEHFYRDIEPWIHYIPFKSDLSDFIKNLQWAMDNEEEALKIGRAGSTYARENILPQDIFCYHAHLFYEWSKKLESRVDVRKGMELVKQKNDDKNCLCYKNYNPDNRKDEL